MVDNSPPIVSHSTPVSAAHLTAASLFRTSLPAAYAPVKMEFNPTLGTFLLPIAPSRVNLPDNQTLTIEEKEFRRKAEFHVTMLGKKVGTLVKSAMQVDGLLHDHIIQFILENPVSFQLESDALKICKDKPQSDGPTLRAESVIKMVTIEGADKLYERFSQLLGISVPVPPHHVTLYTHADHGGIGITSAEELAACKPEIILLG